jgi:hypothetical protein
MAKRRRARENPLKTRDKALIAGGGVVLLSTILYFVTRSKTEVKKDSTTTNGKGGSTQDGGKGGSTQDGGAQPGSTVSQTPYGPTVVASTPTPSNITQSGSAVARLNMPPPRLKTPVTCPQGFKWGGWDEDNPNLPKCIPV